MDRGMKDKVALVCASSTDLGRAVAEGLARERARVAMCAACSSFFRETQDPEGDQQENPGHKHWVRGPIAGSPEGGGARRFNCLSKAPSLCRRQLFRLRGFFVIAFVPRACAPGFPESPLQGWFRERVRPTGRAP